MRTRPRRPASELRAAADEPLTVVDRTDGAPVPYRLAWRWQRDLVARRAAGEIGDVVLLLQHRPTFTLGTASDRDHLLFDDDELAQHGIEVVEVDRGGDITYHGPGQLVGYPVMALDGPRVVDHVRALEELNIRLLADLGVRGERVAGYTGVWVGHRKLTAIGVRVSTARWITQHGWATNVDPAMAHWRGIVACGIDDPDRTVGSLRALGVGSSVQELAARTVDQLASLYDTRVERRTAVP